MLVICCLLCQKYKNQISKKSVHIFRFVYTHWNYLRHHDMTLFQNRKLLSNFFPLHFKISFFWVVFWLCLSKQLRAYIYLSAKMFIISCVDASFMQVAPRRCARSMGSMHPSCSTFLEMHSDALIPINAFSFIVFSAHSFHLKPIKVLLVAHLMFLKN